MQTRRIILFKVNGEVVVEENKDLTPTEIENMKFIVAEEIEVPVFDVDVEFIDMPLELSEIDVTTDGLLDWKDSYFKPIIGVKLCVEVGSDAYLDALLNGTMDKYIEFVKEQ